MAEHDPSDDEVLSRRAYFDPESNTSTGQTYPDNLVEIIEAGEEANRILCQVGNLTTDVDALFAESEGRIL